MAPLSIQKNAQLDSRKRIHLPSAFAKLPVHVAVRSTHSMPFSYQQPQCCVLCSYPATRSAPYIDALVGDRVVAPPELRLSAYGEQIIDMPYSYHVTDQASVSGQAKSLGVLSGFG